MVRTVFMVSNTSRNLAESDNSSTIVLFLSDAIVFYNTSKKKSYKNFIHSWYCSYIPQFDMLHSKCGSFSPCNVISISMVRDPRPVAGKGHRRWGFKGFGQIPFWIIISLKNNFHVGRWYIRVWKGGKELYRALKAGFRCTLWAMPL